MSYDTREPSDQIYPRWLAFESVELDVIHMISVNWQPCILAPVINGILVIQYMILVHSISTIL
jgi:hypothetical protein